MCKNVPSQTYIHGNILTTQGANTGYRIDQGGDFFPQSFIYVHTVNEHVANQMMLGLNSGSSYTINYSLTITRIA